MTPLPAEELQLGFGFADAPGAFALCDEEPEEVRTAIAVADRTATAERLLARLRELGLRHVRTLRLTNNRAVLVSVKGFELRVHAGFVGAAEAHEQIVRFVMAPHVTTVTSVPVTGISALPMGRASPPTGTSSFTARYTNFGSKKMTGSFARSAAFMRPYALRGPDGMRTKSPGVWTYMISSLSL